MLIHHWKLEHDGRDTGPAGLNNHLIGPLNFTEDDVMGWCFHEIGPHDTLKDFTQSVRTSFGVVDNCMRGDFTISFRVKILNWSGGVFGSNTSFIGISNNVAGHMTRIGAYGMNDVFVSYNSTDPRNITSSDGSNWNTITVTYRRVSATDNLNRLYLNGVLVSEETVVTSMDWATVTGVPDTMSIGSCTQDYVSRTSDSGAVGDDHEKLMSDVRIYDHELTQEEVTEIFNEGGIELNFQETFKADNLLDKGVPITVNTGCATVNEQNNVSGYVSLTHRGRSGGSDHYEYFLPMSTSYLNSIRDDFVGKWWTLSGYLKVNGEPRIMNINYGWNAYYLEYTANTMDNGYFQFSTFIDKQLTQTNVMDMKFSTPFNEGDVIEFNELTFIKGKIPTRIPTTETKDVTYVRNVANTKDDFRHHPFADNIMSHDDIELEVSDGFTINAFTLPSTINIIKENDTNDIFKLRWKNYQYAGKTLTISGKLFINDVPVELNSRHRKMNLHNQFNIERESREDGYFRFTETFNSLDLTEVEWLMNMDLIIHGLKAGDFIRITDFMVNDGKFAYDYADTSIDIGRFSYDYEEISNMDTDDDRIVFDNNKSLLGYTGSRGVMSLDDTKSDTFDSGVLSLAHMNMGTSITCKFMVENLVPTGPTAWVFNNHVVPSVSHREGLINLHFNVKDGYVGFHIMTPTPVLVYDTKPYVNGSVVEAVIVLLENTCHMYFDGLFVESVSFASTGDIPGLYEYPIMFGTHTTSSGHDNYVSVTDFKIDNYAKTAEQVKEDYYKGIDGKLDDFVIDFQDFIPTRHNAFSDQAFAVYSHYHSNFISHGPRLNSFIMLRETLIAFSVSGGGIPVIVPEGSYVAVSGYMFVNGEPYDFSQISIPNTYAEVEDYRRFDNPNNDGYFSFILHVSLASAHSWMFHMYCPNLYVGDFVEFKDLMATPYETGDFNVPVLPYVEESDNNVYFKDTVSGRYLTGTPEPDTTSTANVSVDPTDKGEAYGSDGCLELGTVADGVHVKELSVDSKEFTVTTALKTGDIDAIGLSRAIINLLPISDGNEIRWYINHHSGEMQLYVGGVYHTSVEGRLESNTEHVFVMTMTETTVQIYLNGALIFSTSARITTPGQLYIKLHDSLGADAKVYDISVYNRHFTAEEALNEYRRLSRIHNVSTYKEAFADNTNVTAPVPALWNRHPHTEGTDAFRNNTNAENFDDIPLGWGGDFKLKEAVINIGTVESKQISLPSVSILETLNKK